MEADPAMHWYVYGLAARLLAGRTPVLLGLAGVGFALIGVSVFLRLRRARAARVRASSGFDGDGDAYTVGALRVPLRGAVEGGEFVLAEAARFKHYVTGEPVEWPAGTRLPLRMVSLGTPAVTVAAATAKAEAATATSDA